MQETKIFCDVCKEEIEYYGLKNKLETQKQEIQVIFTTDQNEGRSCNPYLSIQDIDICKNCKDKILEGKYLFAEGAMGHNKYYFK